MCCKQCCNAVESLATGQYQQLSWNNEFLWSCYVSECRIIWTAAFDGSLYSQFGDRQSLGVWDVTSHTRVCTRIQEIVIDVLNC